MVGIVRWALHDGWPRDRFPSFREKSDIIMSPRTLPCYGDYHVAAKVFGRVRSTRVVRANDRVGEFFSRVHGVSSFIKDDWRREGERAAEDVVRRVWLARR